MNGVNMPVMPAEELQRRLPALLDEVAGDEQRVIAVGRDGQPQVAIVQWRRWNELSVAAGRPVRQPYEPRLGRDLPRQTMEEGINYEVAEDVLGLLVAWCSAQIGQERAK